MMKRVLLTTIAAISIAGAASAEIIGGSGNVLSGLTFNSFVNMGAGADGQGDLVHTGDATSFDNSWMNYNSCGDGQCQPLLLEVNQGGDVWLNTKGVNKPGEMLVIQHQIVKEFGFSLCPDGCN